jgi:hypothetical protein
MLGPVQMLEESSHLDQLYMSVGESMKNSLISTLYVRSMRFQFAAHEFPRFLTSDISVLERVVF